MTNTCIKQTNFCTFMFYNLEYFIKFKVDEVKFVSNE